MIVGDFEAQMAIIGIFDQWKFLKKKCSLLSMEVPGIMIYPSFKVIWEMLMKVFWDDKKGAFHEQKKMRIARKIEHINITIMYVLYVCVYNYN
jgi:hypothetical protein